MRPLRAPIRIRSVKPKVAPPTPSFYLYSWGWNSYGELGLGEAYTHPNITDSIFYPEKIGDSLWISVCAGNKHVVGVQKEGSLWSWGYNNLGQLGTGDTVNKTVPTRIGTDNDWILCSAGIDISFAIKKDGSLWGWGAGLHHGLGLNSIENVNVPTKMHDGPFKFISSGDAYGLAIHKNGNLYSWGRNIQAECGAPFDYYATQEDNYVKVVTLVDESDWEFVECSKQRASFGIKSDNTLWAWGWSADGQLGIRNYDLSYEGTDSYPILQIGSDTWKNVSCAGFWSHGINSLGVRYVAGFGGGWFGTGEESPGSFDVFTETDTCGIDTDCEYSATSPEYVSCIIRSDKTLWISGSTWDGQGADGTYDTRNIFTKIESLSGVHKVSLGDWFVIAMVE